MANTFIRLANAGEDDSSDDGAGQFAGSSTVKQNKTWIPALDDSNYFEDLAPEQIYDSFFSIKRMGFIANRIIRKLNDTKHIVSSKILEKRKKLKALQRKQFEQLSPAGIEYLKVLLKLEITALKFNTPMDLLVPVSPHIKARLSHLAVDLQAVELLHKIYGPEGAVRSLDLWKALANDFVNNPQWVPRRVVDDRLYDIDPAYAPEEKFSADSLRSAFSRLRIEFTKALLKFNSTPKGSLAADSLDGEFWEKFAKHDKGLYYIYLLFKGVNESDCLMLDPALSRTDYELDLTPYAVSAGIKRDHSLMEDESLYLMGDDGGAGGAGGIRGGLGEDEEAWTMAVKKNRCLSQYYKRMTLNEEVKFYLEMLNKESTGEALKRNIRNKVNVLLLKKVEDRYDDLNFNFFV